MAAAATEFPGQSREWPLGQRNWVRGRIRGFGFKWSSLAHGSREISLHTKEKHTHTHIHSAINANAHGFLHKSFSTVSTEKTRSGSKSKIGE